MPERFEPDVEIPDATYYAPVDEYAADAGADLAAAHAAGELPEAVVDRVAQARLLYCVPGIEDGTLAERADAFDEFERLARSQGKLAAVEGLDGAAVREQVAAAADEKLADSQSVMMSLVTVRDEVQSRGGPDDIAGFERRMTEQIERERSGGRSAGGR